MSLFMCLLAGVSGARAQTAVPLRTDYINPKCTDARADLLGLETYLTQPLLGDTDAVTCEEFILSQSQCGLVKGSLPTYTMTPNELCVGLTNVFPELKGFVWYHCALFCQICEEDNVGF
jgi:hypothetical protein